MCAASRLQSIQIDEVNSRRGVSCSCDEPAGQPLPSSNIECAYLQLSVVLGLARSDCIRARSIRATSGLAPKVLWQPCYRQCAQPTQLFLVVQGQTE